MLKIFIIISSLFYVWCQNLTQLQYEVRQAAQCGFYLHNKDQDAGTWTIGFRSFNDGAYRVKQASVEIFPQSTVLNGRNESFTIDEQLFIWPGIGQTPGLITVPVVPELNVTDVGLALHASLLLVDDSIFCVSALYFEDFCFSYAQDTPCPKRIRSLRRPATCLVNGGPETSVSQCIIGDEPEEDWRCVNGDCVHIQSRFFDQPCANLDIRPLVPRYVGSNGAVRFGARVTDCEGSVLDSITAEQVGVWEQDTRLSALDTKQNLQRIPGKNYVQLMVSMCPRTMPLLTDFITALHLFKRQLDFADTYVALTVFDGARGYVDLLHFTNNYDTLSYAIDGLREYQVRDDSCNLFEAVNAKFIQFSSLKFGQPWDRLNFVLFSASSDLSGFARGFSLGFFSRSAAVTSYFIGVDLTASITPNIDQFFDFVMVPSDPTAIIDAMVDVARNLGLRSDYLLGYCSPARQGDITARWYWQFPETTSLVYLWTFEYDASSFGSCTVNMDYCSPCSTEISRSSIVCPQCFNSDSQNIVSTTSDVQILLRCPNNGGNDCSLSLSNVTGSFNIYIRRNGLSNPLFYDNKFTDVEVAEMPLYLPFISAGDLVGIFVEWKEATVFESVISLLPTAATPDSAPVVAPYADAPYPDAPYPEAFNPAPNSPISSVNSAGFKLGLGLFVVTMGFVLVF